MTQSEAIRQIENWLLVPVDFDSILPALAVLRSTSEFDEYVSRVAEAEFKTSEDIIQDIDAYIAKQGTSHTEGMLAIEQKLEALSGRTRQLHKELRSRSEDVLDMLAKRRQPKTEADRREDAMKSYMEKSRRNDKRNTSLAPQCLACHATLAMKEENKVLPLGWAIFGVLLVFCFPLCFIPLIIFREKQVVYTCPRCGRRA